MCNLSNLCIAEFIIQNLVEPCKQTMLQMSILVQFHPTREMHTKASSYKPAANIKQRRCKPRD